MFNASAHKAPAAVTLPFEISRLEEIARETGLIQLRSPGFSAQGFLLSLFKAVGHGHASFQQMALNSAKTHAKAAAPPPEAYSASGKTKPGETTDGIEG